MIINTIKKMKQLVLFLVKYIPISVKNVLIMASFDVGITCFT